MGREGSADTLVTPQAVEAYLRQHGHADAVVTHLSPLGQRTQEGLKSYGYGRPLRATYKSCGQIRDVVVRTMSPDPFGHDRRADRANVLLLAHDTFKHIPQHIAALDHGAFDAQGQLVSIPPGEFFLLTNYVDGELYAADLHAAQDLAQARPRDLQRAGALALYLAELHRTPATTAQYQRSLRDTVGSGEGIFGMIDGYPPEHRFMQGGRLRELELAAVRWRWQLRDKVHRARRNHGDFHPFNLLFRDGVDFSVLDCSRGAAGDPADDVACLTINYLFFSLTTHGTFSGALRQVWDLFWDTYLRASGDQELLTVVAPYYAWRALVVASPVWYPDLSEPLRDRLLGFVERLLAGAPFHPTQVDKLL